MNRSLGQSASKTTGAVTELEPGSSRAVSSTAAQKELSGKLAGLSLPRQVIVLAFWPLLEQLMSFLVGTVDLALAGRLKPDNLVPAATDALGVAAYFGWLMSLIHSAVGVGAAALVARAIGARHKRLANSVLGQSILMAVCSGIFVALCVFITAPWLAPPGMTPQAENWCVLYLRMIAAVSPASAVLMVGSAALRSAGDTRSPFAMMVVVNVVNIIASCLFVFGPAPLGGHAVAGIAAGTQIAWCVGAVLTLIILARGAIVRLHRHRLRPHWHTMKRILRVGLPNLAEGVGGMWMGNYFVLMIVSTLGISGVIGAHMMAIRAESLSFLPGFAIGISAATLVGQYLGLGDPHRAQRAAQFCWALAAAMMSSFGIAFFLFPRFFVHLMTDNPDIVNMAAGSLRIAGLFQFFFATQMVFVQALRGAGDTRATLAMTASSILLVRVPLAYLFGHTLGYGLNGIWFALCTEMALRATLYTARFYHGGWKSLQI